MGIGGIGVSGIAEIVRLQGYPVSGCDVAAKGTIIDHLRTLGCEIYQGHSCDHIQNADVLVHSSAVKQDNIEVQAALTKGIPVIPRAIMLAELMRTKFSIAVSGMHGKTTTTSLISHILIEAQRKPTVIIGGTLKSINTNAQLGDSDLLIAEADESDRSLLYLNPTMAVVTNIDAEHLDVYENIADIKQTFKHFLARLPFYGKAFVCIDDPHIQSILPLTHVSCVKYGFSTKADIMGNIIELLPAQSIFDVYVFGGLVGRITLNIPGEHNILNALAAIAVCRELDVSFEQIAAGLQTFKGVERRFEFKGTCQGAEIFDDYGHHPVEIKKTLVVAQRRTKNKLHVLFQPHRYTRTQKLWDDFVDIFTTHHGYEIESLFMTEIYPASEQAIPNITGKRLVEAIKLKKPNLKITFCETYDEIAALVKPLLHEGDLLLTVGAGKINVVGEQLLKKA